MYESYSQLTNEIFFKYIKDIDNNLKKTEKDSILNLIKDDKLIIVLHELYINTSFRRNYQMNLDFFIEKCGYQVNQKSKKNFKELFNKLKEIKLIDFDNLENRITIIDTQELLLKSSKGYFQISDKEIDIFNNVKDLRLRTTLFKLYTYLKATVNKRKINNKTGKIYNIQVEPVPQVTWQSYEYIEQYINIGQSHMTEYIKQLKELKLIDYTNCGKKYHSQDKSKRLSECPNVYTITILNDCGDEQELELGLKQCKQHLEEKGWIITKKDYKDNNRKINGKIGGLTKKLNNGTITNEQKEELENLTKEKDQTKLNSNEATL